MISADFDGFRPAPYLPGRHLQTIVPAFFPPSWPPRESETLQVEAAPGNRLLLRVDRPAAPRGTLVLVHGLGGSADSGYMRRTASLALSRGWITVRVNLRNCGGTEALARTLYNAGQSDDAGSVLESLAEAGFARPFTIVGFSLGGNLVLRYAGMAGGRCHAAAIAAVNPPVDLEASVRSLERWNNAVYHGYFTWRLCSLLRRIRRVRIVPGPAADPLRIRSVRRFDELFTAPDAGYASADDYYRHASAAPFLETIAVPTLILSSRDDPFVPAEIFRSAREACPRLTLVQPGRGGHVGYWQAHPPRFWAGWAVLEYLEEVLGWSERPAGGNPDAISRVF
ncbi:MAG TPA: alpha/beta fold hydrolase [Candidatus Polarisedimenticolia bacterium]|nr:alpha/beta fold hydrolase [Candidatus Polarisedimenticolia bacterium]